MIRPGPFGDLEYQARLTDTLLTARPAYGAAVAWPDWPDLVAEMAGAPVTVRSAGPAAPQKAGDVRALGEAVSR